MGAHTPGPWIASLGEYAFTNSGQRAVTTDAGDDGMPVHIAFVSPVADRKRSTPYNAPDPERDANARLIAAAPDLLAALEALLPYVEHSDSCGDRDAYNNADVETCGCGLDSAVDVARAAIALATGGHR